MGKKVTQSVEDVIPAVVGNFRVALQAATPLRALKHCKRTIFSARQANELLSAAITQMSSDEFQRLGSVKNVDYLTELLFTADAKEKFHLSHSIVTQMAPKPSAPDVGGISELIDKFKEVKATTSTEDLPGEVTKMVESLAPSYQYHSEYSLQWANNHAPRLLFESAITRGMLGVIRNFFQLVSPSAKGQFFEAMFMSVHHPIPYLILNKKGAWTRMTLDLSQAFRSQDDKTNSENVTVFSETGSPPFELLVDSLFTLHNDQKARERDFAYLVRRFDPLSKQHKDFDMYVGDYPNGLDEEVRVLLIQQTTGLSHRYRPGRLYKMTNKFKRMLTKKLNLPSNRVVVMPVVLSTFDKVNLKIAAETVAHPTKVLDENDIDTVSQNDIDKGKKLPFFYINMNKHMESVKIEDMNKTVTVESEDMNKNVTVEN